MRNGFEKKIGCFPLVFGLFWFRKSTLVFIHFVSVNAVRFQCQFNSCLIFVLAVKNIPMTGEFLQDVDILVYSFEVKQVMLAVIFINRFFAIHMIMQVVGGRYGFHLVISIISE